MQYDWKQFAQTNKTLQWIQESNGLAKQTMLGQTSVALMGVHDQLIMELMFCYKQQTHVVLFQCVVPAIRFQIVVTL
jgi:hypothetical protein